MAKIKRIVEIDEEVYNTIMCEPECPVLGWYEVAHSVPYNQSDDLIGREALRKEVTEKVNFTTVDGHIAYDTMLKLIDNAPSVGISEENLKPTSERVKDIVGFDVSKMPKLPEYTDKGECKMTGLPKTYDGHKLGDFVVGDSGISKIIEVDGYAGYTAELVLPKETFIEAYNKYIKGGDKNET